MTPQLDQSLRFNADEILKQRANVLDLILELPNLSIKDFENRLFAMAERQKPLEQRLEEYGNKFAEQAKEK